MDESRIPKAVEKIVRLDPDKPQVLFKRKAKDKDKGLSRLRKSVKDAALALADVQRRGTEALVEKLPSPTGSGDVFEMVSDGVMKARKRGMKLLRGK